jgi:hypothetical protein
MNIRRINFMQYAKRYTDTITDEDGKEVRRFILELGEHRVILSSPSIQAYHEYEFEDITDALYFYHNFIIEKNRNYNVFDDEDTESKEPKWEELTSVYVYEDSSTRVLPYFIDMVIDYDIKNESKKNYFTEQRGFSGEKKQSTTDYECREYFDLKGFEEEDCYTIVKFCRNFAESYNKKTERYEPKYVEFYEMGFFCGCSEVDRNPEGFIAYLEEPDLLVIKDWANEFLEYAMELTKSKIKEALASTEIEDFYCPGVVRKHIQDKYPEDIDKFEEIFKTIDRYDFIADRYYEWITGQTPEKEIEVTTPDKKKRSLPSLIESGMKDWEAAEFMVLTIMNYNK